MSSKEKAVRNCVCQRRTCIGSSVAAVLPGTPPVPLYLCSGASCSRTVSFSRPCGSCMGLALLSSFQDT